MNQKSNSSMKVFILIFISGIISCQKPKPEEHLTTFEKSKGKQSAPYEEGIEWWKNLDAAFSEVEMTEAGLTDEGLPLHVVMVGREDEGPDQRKKPLLLINNAIHPGEPDGVDATMMLIRDLMFNERLKNTLLDHIQIAIIPYYNIGGARNRNSHSRANQLGPEEYGFRGNAMNLDLNRDFTKQDSKNAVAFAEIFHRLDPDLYIETHVSNGADYRHAITCLPTLYQKLDPPLGNFFKEKIEDEVYKIMAGKGQHMIPYVNIFNTPPDSGIRVFIDGPRYSSGYAALFQTPGFITETLMLRPFVERVHATYDFILSVMELMPETGRQLLANRRKAREYSVKNEMVTLDWEVNPDTFIHFAMNGYQAVYRYSDITGDTLLGYDRTRPVKLKVPYYREVKPTLSHKIPKYYILENGFHRVKDKLKSQDIQYETVNSDTQITVTLLRIHSYETAGEPYEGHYFHHHTQYEEIVREIRIPAGSWMIPSRQKAGRFLAEVFFPDAPDSYFNWNFFDTRLQQKEWYSSYVFEPKAREMLNNHPELKTEFENKIRTDSAFAANPHERLYYLYKKSPHYEWQHRVLPVYLLF